MQTTEGFGNGSVDRVFPKLVNGVVKEANLAPELAMKVFLAPQNDIGDNNYTLVMEDAGRHIKATDCTITVPYYYDVDFEVGTRITIVSGGDNVVIQRAGSSTTIWFQNSDYGSYTLYPRNVAQLIKTGNDEWYLYGNNISVND